MSAPKKKPRQDLKRFALSKSPTQSLDHACGTICIEGKWHRYYGTHIYETVVRRGKPKTILSPVLIVDDGRIISPLQESIHSMSLKTQMSPTLSLTKWELVSIKNFVEGRTKNISFSEVFSEFKKIYEMFMLFDEAEYYSLNAVWDLLSYAPDLCDKSLILKHEGLSGSAKSKCMKISGNLGFNARRFVMPSPATFFRYRHQNKSLILIEEAERLFSKNPKGDDSTLLEYLNASYEKGNLVPRCAENNRAFIEEFDPYGFTRIGSIAPLQGALEKRSVVIGMIPAPKSDPRGNLDVPSENDALFRRARNKAYICWLQNWQSFESALNSVENICGLANRSWTSVKPLLALASCISPDLKLSLEKFLSNQFDNRLETFHSASWETLFSAKLLKVLPNEPEFFSNSRLQEIFAMCFEYPPTLTSHGLGRLMSTLGLRQFCCRKSSERGYTLGSEQVRSIFERLGIIEDSSPKVHEESVR